MFCTGNTHTHTHTHIHTYIHTYTHTHVCTHTHTPTYIYTYIHTYIHTCQSFYIEISKSMYVRKMIISKMFVHLYLCFQMSLIVHGLEIRSFQTRFFLHKEVHCFMKIIFSCTDFTLLNLSQGNGDLHHWVQNS